MSISVDLQAKIAGNEELARMATELQKVERGAEDLEKIKPTYFEQLKKESEAATTNLKDQIKYVREAININAQLEQVGYSQRMTELREEYATTGKWARRRMRPRLTAEMTEHGLAREESVRARAELQEYAREMGMAGEVPERGAGGWMSDLAGGMVGGYGIRRFLGRTIRKAGPIGLGVYAGYKAVSWVGQGMDKTKQWFSDLTPLAQQLGVTHDKFVSWSNAVREAGEAARMSAPEVLALMQAYTVGTGATAAEAETMVSSGLWAQALGLPAGTPSAWAAQRYGLTGRRPGPTDWKRFAATGMAGGVETARIPIYSEMADVIAEAIGRTRRTVPTGMAEQIAASMWNWGPEYQGQRGLQMFQNIQGAIRAPRGNAMQAFMFRQAKDWLGEDASLPDIWRTLREESVNPVFWQHAARGWQRTHGGIGPGMAEELAITEFELTGGREDFRKMLAGTYTPQKAGEERIAEQISQIDKMAREFADQIATTFKEFHIVTENVQVQAASVIVSGEASLLRPFVGSTHQPSIFTGGAPNPTGNDIRATSELSQVRKLLPSLFRSGW